LPYLQELYDPSSDHSDEELNEDFAGIHFESGPRSSSELLDEEGTKETRNGNNNEVIKSTEIPDGETREVRKDKRRSLKKTSSAGRLLSCLGVDMKCKQS
jgi:hypothetical protein